MMGDDAAGPVVLDRLSGRVRDTIALIESVGDATHLLESWRDARLALVVDAVVSGGVPGSVQRIEARKGFPSAWRSASTHLVGVAEAIELGGVIGVLPAELIVYGIEIGSVEAGVRLSPEVNAAADRVTGMIVAELSPATTPG
jgi:hydrogenase maturation protease